MLAEDLNGTVQGQRFHGVAPAGGRRGLEKRVVNGLFGGLDNGKEQWRRVVVCETFEIAGRISFVLGERFDTYAGRSRVPVRIMPTKLPRAVCFAGSPVIRTGNHDQKYKVRLSFFIGIH